MARGKSNKGAGRRVTDEHKNYKLTFETKAQGKLHSIMI